MRSETWKSKGGAQRPRFANPAQSEILSSFARGFTSARNKRSQYECGARRGIVIPLSKRVTRYKEVTRTAGNESALLKFKSSWRLDELMVIDSRK